MDRKKIRDAAKIACLLEASSYPKPGNVNPFDSFHDLTYDDFVASSKTVAQSCRKTAMQAKKKFTIGKNIYGAAKKTSRISGTNVNLGILLLLVPLSAAASVSKPPISPKLKGIMRKTTVDDALYFVKSVRAARPFILPHKLDVNSEKLDAFIKKNRVTFRKLMELSSRSDDVAKELTQGLKKTLCAKEYLERLLRKKTCINDAVCQAFLFLLSKYPDKLVEKKAGKKSSLLLMKKAKLALSKGGVLEEAGLKKVFELDRFLRKRSGKMNPGSMADILCAAVFLSILEEPALFQRKGR